MRTASVNPNAHSGRERRKLTRLGTRRTHASGLRWPSRKRPLRASARSVRHRPHLPYEYFLEAEVPQIAHALRVEDAVEVIDLVLHHPGVEGFHGAVDGCTLDVEAAIAQPLEAGH